MIPPYPFLGTSLSSKEIKKLDKQLVYAKWGIIALAIFITGFAIAFLVSFINHHN